MVGKLTEQICLKPTLLDCFCGMGGVSDGFAMEGFDVTGIDIVDAPKMLGYKHKFIQADMFTLRGEDFRGYDVIWGSPPCRDFSRMAQCGKGSIRTDGNRSKWAWKVPPNPKKGMELVNCYLYFVRNAMPKIWIMENVPNLQNYLSRIDVENQTIFTWIIKPRQISQIGRTMKRAFWGNFPNFLMPSALSPNLCKGIWHIQGKYRSWQRAKIPLPCSRAFAKACKEKLVEVGV